MDDERITGAVWIPIQHDDYAALRELLNSADPLVTGNYVDGGGFDLTEYLVAAKLGGVEFRALFDRNILSPLAALAAGKPLAGSEESMNTARIACAAVAFCIMAEILVEPSMALYEYASTQGNSAAKAELISFRVADNIDPTMFVDIAMGRSDRIPKGHLARVETDSSVSGQLTPESNFEKTLRMWRPNYLYVLKMTALRRSGLSPLEAALEFQRWQSEDSFYNAAASMYCLASASHQPPKGQMVKGIGSANLATLKKGVRNAVWDICLIQQFGRYVTTPGGPSWSLWTLDKAVRDVARALFVQDGQSELAALAAFYSACWGRDGQILHRSYVRNSTKAAPASEARKASIDAAFHRIDVDIKALEDELGFGAA
jgi:hypothetical protein